LIARHDHKTATAAAFSGGAIIGINEIGLVVEDVPTTVIGLERAYGVSPYLDLSHPEFTAVGGIEGLFIVVKRHRPWLPTGQPATSGWFSATIQTQTGQHILSTDSID
jgi:hypothetical protein